MVCSTITIISTDIRLTYQNIYR